MRNYCTLFDKNYLAKGMAMLDSLRRHSSEEFRLFILFMDEESRQVFEQLKPDNCYGVLRSSVEGFQNLSTCKLNRTWQEYCWTCASQLADFLIAHHGLPEVTYLDADLFFFSDPKPVHDEIGERSIGIIEHRLIPAKRHLHVNGRFNVGWVSFKNTPIGQHCLDTWASNVRERCDASTCGDQKYLDEWPGMYGDEVCIVQNIGANVAPWNVGNYELRDFGFVDGRRIPHIHLPLTSDEPVCPIYPIVFYHFHEYVHREILTFYELRPEDVELIYRPYEAAIDAAGKQIEALRIQQSC